ncbi:MAG: TonB-dependent receptor [Pyrinomonadaceae bacterium]|nr:TonB-dependent receptor [Pyrinomonadaceae bacterium]MCX7638947.1 TonB-dependent receptor [Pyrinomonadaceae bacterium]MDW8304916.1 TonB-dependent receptor [Acidobacteriota bacterium]
MKTALFLLLLFSLQSLAQTGAVIKGRVTYGDAKIPIHDAVVSIPALNLSTTTDENGYYEIKNIPKGRHTILVHLEGFVDQTKNLELSSDQVAEVDFNLQISSIKAQVTVTASEKIESIFDSFHSVNSVPSTRIVERASTSIGEVLESEVGVNKRSFGPSTSRPVIRGFDGDRVLILQDGVRSGSISSQSGDHGEPLEPLTAERIEIVKGPATLLYGSNAIGGVVNVISGEDTNFHSGLTGFISSLANTANRQGALAGGFEYGLQRFMIRGGGSFNRAGDYNTPIGKIFNSASRTNSGFFGLGYYARKGWLSGSYNFDLRRYGIPFAQTFTHHHHEDDEEEVEQIDLRMKRNNARINGGFRDFNGSFLSSIQYKLDYTEYQHKEIEVIEGRDFPGTIFDNKIFSYRTLFEQAKYKNLTGRFGFEGFNRRYVINGEEQLIQGRIKHNSFSAFTLQELNFERIKLQFGGRIENNNYSPENAELRKRTFTGFSGAFGLNIGLWQGGSFVFNYTNSYRAAAIEELYNYGPHIGNVTFEIGNQNLKAEKANGVDFSIRHASEKFNLIGDVFYYRIDNFVFLAPQDEDGDGQVDIEDGLPVAKYEQSDAEYMGAEINLNAQLNKHLGSFFSFDTVRARLVNKKINLPRIPPTRARLGLDLRYKDLSIRPEVLFATSQNKTFPLETRTGGYTVYNIAGSYTIARQHQAHIFTVYLYNLTDRLYRNHVSFIKDLAPEIGRGIKVGYTVRFF